jgi:hypothetical protein
MWHGVAGQGQSREPRDHFASPSVPHPQPVCSKAGTEAAGIKGQCPTGADERGPLARRRRAVDNSTLQRAWCASTDGSISTEDDHAGFTSLFAAVEPVLTHH